MAMFSNNLSLTRGDTSRQHNMTNHQSTSKYCNSIHQDKENDIINIRLLSTSARSAKICQDARYKAYNGSYKRNIKITHDGEYKTLVKGAINFKSCSTCQHIEQILLSGTEIYKVLFIFYAYLS